jgi:hypothetical protein
MVMPTCVNTTLRVYWNSAGTGIRPADDALIPLLRLNSHSRTDELRVVRQPSTTPSNSSKIDFAFWRRSCWFV